MIVADFVARTIDIARNNVTAGGRPFATVIVRDGEILAESPNLVAQTHDPTAHAEILAIREACVRLGTEHLVGATIYVLAHPCPMCLGALYYCSPDEVVFLTTRDAYEPHYVDDRKYFELDTFYQEFAKSAEERRLPMRYEPREDAVDVYRLWQDRNGGDRRVADAPRPRSSAAAGRQRPDGLTRGRTGKLRDLPASHISCCPDQDKQCAPMRRCYFLATLSRGFRLQPREISTDR